MPFKPPEQNKCPLCGKSVYAAEEKIGAGKKWHKLCFKCGICNKALDSRTCAEHEGMVFCKGCHGKRFGPKGYGFGQGAGALSTETGAQFGNTESEMTNIPRSNAIIGGIGPGPHCGRCGKTVYDMEKAVGMTDPWHKMCCSCRLCGKKLDPSNLNRHENEIFCKGCYSKNFGTTGYGFGIGAGCLSTGT